MPGDTVDDRARLHAKAVSFAALMLKTYREDDVSAVEKTPGTWRSGPDLFVGKDSVCVRASRSKYRLHRAKQTDGVVREYKYWRLQWSLNSRKNPCRFEPDFWCLVGYSEGVEPFLMLVPREKLERRGSIGVLLRSLDTNFLSQYML